MTFCVPCNFVGGFVMGLPKTVCLWWDFLSISTRDKVTERNRAFSVFLNIVLSSYSQCLS